ncbi:hypothetical protein [Azospirillum agricola]|uniref:hypothetical protein n=1 Tax=Azospirillum agricola TaxID=1720247 RepID=UPI000A0F3ECB|nr:hypothetical protein [Azospirillum agricola]SMH58802.1 hypothetical protein SAMN02982994_4769 [Azospirillum lipoferum]
MTDPKSDEQIDVEALEDTMDEVLETLAVTEQAAAFIEANCHEADCRDRANAIRRQAEAMQDAADTTIDERMSGEDGDDAGASRPSPPSTARRNGLLH